MPPNIMINFTTNPKGEGNLFKKLKKLKFTLTNIKINDKNPMANKIKPINDKIARLFMSQ